VAAILNLEKNEYNSSRQLAAIQQQFESILTYISKGSPNFSDNLHLEITDNCCYKHKRRRIGFLDHFIHMEIVAAF